MRVTQVDLNCAGGVPICRMSFRDPGAKNKYNAKAIIGLDADELLPRYYGKSATNKPYFALSLQRREIIIRIKLNPDFSVGESYSNLRDDIYRKISVNRTGKVVVNFNDGDAKVATISGFVTKFEAPHFNKEPEVQVTIKCDNPMLSAPDPVEIDVEGLDPSDTLIVDPISTAFHGFKMKMLFLSDQPSFTIASFDDEWEFEVIPGGGFLQDDILCISTEYGEKHVYIDRQETIIQMADKVSLHSIWPIMFPQNNRLKCSPGVEWYSISHYPTYWGV